MERKNKMEKLIKGKKKKNNWEKEEKKKEGANAKNIALLA